MKILPGFLPLNVCSIFGAILSISLNSLVIFLMLTRTSNLDDKTKKFSLTFSILGLIYAICQSLSQPFFFAYDKMGVYFFGSFLHDSLIPVYAQKIFMSPCYIIIIMLCTANFMYKYAATCSPRLRRLFDTTWFICTLSFFGASYIIAYLYIRWTKIVPSAAFVEKVASKLNDHFHTDFRKVFVSGVDTTVQNEHKDPSYAILMLLFFLLMIGSIFMMVFCGYRIHSAIWRKKMSDRARKQHRKVLSLIILQALNPFLFMIMPGFVPAILVQLRLNSIEAVSWISAFSLIMFPLFTPIIMLACTKEYRRSFLRMFDAKIPTTSVAEFSLGGARRSTLTN